MSILLHEIFLLITESGIKYGFCPFFELDLRSRSCIGSCVSSACFLQYFFTFSGNIAFECVQKLAFFLHLQHCFKVISTDVVTVVVDKSITSHFNICKKLILSSCLLSYCLLSSCFSKFMEIKQYARFLMPTSKLNIIISHTIFSLFLLYLIIIYLLSLLIIN